jgi:hypothetical protein
MRLRRCTAARAGPPHPRPRVNSLHNAERPLACVCAPQMQHGVIMGAFKNIRMPPASLEPASQPEQPAAAPAEPLTEEAFPPLPPAPELPSTSWMSEADSGAAGEEQDADMDMYSAAGGVVSPDPSSLPQAQMLRMAGRVSDPREAAAAPAGPAAGLPSLRFGSVGSDKGSAQPGSPGTPGSHSRVGDCRARLCCWL